MLRFITIIALLIVDVHCVLDDLANPDFYTIDAPGGNMFPIPTHPSTGDGHLHRRTKRQTLDHLEVLSDADKQAILDKHNEYRSGQMNPTAANMKFMVSCVLCSS